MAGSSQATEPEPITALAPGQAVPGSGFRVARHGGAVRLQRTEARLPSLSLIQSLQPDLIVAVRRRAAQPGSAHSLWHHRLDSSDASQSSAAGPDCSQSQTSQLTVAGPGHSQACSGAMPLRCPEPQPAHSRGSGSRRGNEPAQMLARRGKAPRKQQGASKDGARQQGASKDEAIRAVEAGRDQSQVEVCISPCQLASRDALAV